MEANNWAFFTERLLACAMLTACSSVSTDSGGAESWARAETLLPTRRQNKSGRIMETVLSASKEECKWTARIIIRTGTLSRGNRAPCFGLRSHYPSICLKAASHCSKLLTALRRAEHLSDPLPFH